MKKYKQLLFIFTIITFLFSFNAHRTYADEELTPSKIDSYNSYDYVIDSYDVHMILNEDNTFDITETITAYFHKPKHGIIRSIPLKNTVERLDGTTSENKAQVTDLSVNHEYTTSKRNGNYEVQIGSASHTITGEQTYIIKYTYNLGKDPVKDYDELYFNIIGNEWDTVIGNITFTIEMPKAFDESKLGFSAGNVGSTNSEKVSYTVEGTKITGNYNGILRSGQALTVRCELPEGYFTKSFWNHFLLFLSENYTIFIPITSFIICVAIFIRDKLKYPIVETVEFYPPAGMNSLDVAFLYKEIVTSDDVTSLLICLANKGYISIHEYDNDSFTIQKLNNYDGNDENEKTFLEGLFADKDMVTREDLYNKFYKTEEDIRSNVNRRDNYIKIFGKSYRFPYIPVHGIFIGLLPSTLVLLYKNPLITALCVFLMFYIVRILPASGKKFVLMGSALAIFYNYPFFLVLELLGRGNKILELTPAGIVTVIVCALIPIMVRKPIIKTEYGREMIGKILGFRKFLKIARKEELEDMVMKNPNYFYDILPYAYVLGVSDKWIKKFESISMMSPKWDSSNSISLENINGLYLKTLSTMKASPYTSSDGGLGGSSSSSSGGGSSGGGSGGGGGRSW